MPTLFEDRQPVRPLVSLVYYVRRTSGSVRPLPAGLKMIAGDAEADRPQNLRIASWGCGAVGGGRRFAAVPACAENQFLNMRVDFPSCWNGDDVDSRDHKRHMAYPANGRCPASHPVAVPTISLVVLYPAVGPDAQLSSGRYSAHADFINGWDQDVLTRLVERLD